MARFQRKHKVRPKGNHKRRGIEPLRHRLTSARLVLRRQHGGKRAIRLALRALREAEA